MPDVALISELSHHKLPVQKAEYPDMPHFMAPDEIATMLRPSTRAETLRVHVLSLAVVADNEKDFREFVVLMRKRKAQIVSKEQPSMYKFHHPESLVTAWKLARRKGASKAGCDARSENAERDFWEGFSKIADRWHLSETSNVLMKEAGIKHHDTIRANLGYTRWEWRKLSDAKRARVLKGKF